MSQEAVLEVVSRGIWAIISASAPPLVMGLSVGVLVSIFQTITSIQEPTLAFVPKILAVFLALVIFGPWMLTTLEDYMYGVFAGIPEFLLGGS